MGKTITPFVKYPIGVERLTFVTIYEMLKGKSMSNVETKCKGCACPKLQGCRLGSPPISLDVTSYSVTLSSSVRGDA